MFTIKTKKAIFLWVKNSNTISNQVVNYKNMNLLLKIVYCFIKRKKLNEL